MSNIIQSQTRTQIRQKIAATLNGLSDHAATIATASSGTTNTVVVPRLKASPQGATQLYVGSELYIGSGTGSGQLVFITAFDPTTGTLTVTPSFTTLPDSSSQVEIYSRFSKDQIDMAIDTAFLDGASRQLWPTDIVSSAFESNPPLNWTEPDASRRTMRTEYPIPAQFLWLEQVDYDQNNPIFGWSPSRFDGTYSRLDPPFYRPYANSFQQFSLDQDSWVKYASLYLAYDTNFPTSIYGLQVYIGTVDPGSDMFTALYTSEIRPTADVPREPALVTFTFPQPVRLTAGTTYWLAFGTVNADGTLGALTNGNGYRWGMDSTSNAYTKGQVAFSQDGIAGNTPVLSYFTGQTFIFWLHAPADFRPFKHPTWSVVNSDEWPQLKFDRAVVWANDGTIMRVRGARCLADFTLPTATDSSTPELEPIFLIYKAASLLCTERLLSPNVTPEMIQTQGQLWAQMAEQHRRPFTLPKGAGRKVR